MFKLTILFEDKDLLVVDKPSNLLVHPNSPTDQSWTVERDLTAYLAPQGGKPYLVHRLDKGTSGCLLVAKTPLVKERLRTMFEGHEIKKIYLAAAHPKFANQQGTLRGRLPGRQGELVNAVTHYRLLQKTPYWNLYEIELETGRKNQIRLHFANTHAPLAGDDHFGDFTWNKELRRQVKLKRLLLHAWKISFSHPTTGQKIHVEAPVPEEFGLK